MLVTSAFVIDHGVPRDPEEPRRKGQATRLVARETLDHLEEDPLEEVLGATRSVTEGVGTAYTVHELAEQYNMQMPVCREVYRVLAGEIPAAEAYRGLRIEPGHERDPG